MSALIIDFTAAAGVRRERAARRQSERAAAARHPALSHDFMFWNGASGMRYVHTIYSLLECPEVPDANVVLVRRSADGICEALHIGSVEHGAPSLNLAEIRRTAALLGASEVHVHLLAGNAQHRRLIELDLTGAAGTGRVAS